MRLVIDRLSTLLKLKRFHSQKIDGISDVFVTVIIKISLSTLSVNVTRRVACEYSRFYLLYSPGPMTKFFCSATDLNTVKLVTGTKNVA